MKFTHIFAKNQFADPRTLERQARAEATWVDFDNYGISPSRTGESEGVAEKDVPFVKDVINEGLTIADPIIFTNADTSFVIEAPDILESNIMSGKEVLYSNRFDNLRQERHQLSLDRIRKTGQKVHDGADLFLITRNWWGQVEDDFPDLLIGFEGWDAVMKWYMDWEEAKLDPPIVYHEVHGWAYWQMKRFESQGNKYNHKLLIEWSNKMDHVKLAELWPALLEIINGKPRRRND